MRNCVRDSYTLTLRVHELRQAFVDARTRDREGISSGPFVLRCENFGALISLSYVAATPNLASVLCLADKSLVMERIPADSGAIYVGQSVDGQSVLWVHDEKATFEQPGAQPRSCEIMVPG